MGRRDTEGQEEPKGCQSVGGVPTEGQEKELEEERIKEGNGLLNG